MINELLRSDFIYSVLITNKKFIYQKRASQTNFHWYFLIILSIINSFENFILFFALLTVYRITLRCIDLIIEFLLKKSKNSFNTLIFVFLFSYKLSLGV